MRLGFLVTSPYQLYHYKWIAAEFERVHALIEVRDTDFGLTADVVRQHVPNADVEYVPASRLEELDGRFDVLVCQTPILPLRFLERTLIVAQQYSLAKEAYQYGTWRAHSHLNLMYGQHSVREVEGFAHAVAVGNPMLDPLGIRNVESPDTQAQRDRQHILYLPTYGDLSSIREVVPQLGRLDADITLKVHHAQDLATLGQLPSNVRLAMADTDPIELLRSADAAISDFSGAAFDAAYARLPVLLTGTADPATGDFARLSEAERSHELLTGLGVRWDASGDDFDDALAAAHELQADPEYRARLDLLFANQGKAGEACAAEIRRLVEAGEPAHASRDHVRASTKRYIMRNRELSASLSTARSELAAEAKARAASDEQAAQLHRKLVLADPKHAVPTAIARAREARAAGRHEEAVAVIEGTLRAGAWRRPSLWSERLSLMRSPDEYAQIRDLWLESPKGTHSSVSILRSVARAAAVAGEHDEARALLRKAILTQAQLRKRPKARIGRLKRKVESMPPARSSGPPTGSFEVAAAEAMTALNARLDELGVRAFLISGTLLGYLREGAFIAWDKDIDVGVFTSEIDSAVLEKEFDRLPEFNVRRLDFNSDRLRINHVNGMMIDVFPHYLDDDGRVWHDGTATRWWNSPFELKMVDFLGSKQWIPEVPERYLDENYGDWRTPDPTFDARIDAPNVEVTDQAYFDTLTYFGLLDALVKNKKTMQIRFAGLLEQLGERR